MKTLFMCIFVLVCHNCESQELNVMRIFDSVICSKTCELNSLERLHVVCPKELELPVSLALDHFPNLQAKKILFKQKRIKTTMTARPTLGSLLFSKRSNRTYVIRINCSAKDSVIQLYHIPFNAKIGLLAHEFSHFTDYQSRSFFGVLGRGFSYFSKSGKERFEKEIDYKTIEHGLGWQLYDWADFIQHHSIATSSYKKFKSEIYLLPHEIEERINNYFPNNSRIGSPVIAPLRCK